MMEMSNADSVVGWQDGQDRFRKPIIIWIILNKHKFLYRQISNIRRPNPQT